ncbi:hypothetical protein L1987_01876 [Smallanthus sonchifolius]|uniref:Uncharacterized protein n=1 Tax=Smallanthus sonchifolius TaxID=185202 RepID=A0ACB9K693_9ASTR|nr:hypothetical protein L1987_01876 [Smallanthus sonchifolius]
MSEGSLITLGESVNHVRNGSFRGQNHKCNHSQFAGACENGRVSKGYIGLTQHLTRAVHKLIETLKTRKQIKMVISALEPGFLALIKDLNGNHVIQRCLQCLSNEDNKFIFEAASKFCVDIATHQHGCCVLQRCINHSTGKHQERLILEISANGLLLAQDAFGNYVVQSILELQMPSAVSMLISQFEGNYVHLARQKFSSHVVEKCLSVLDDHSRSKIIRELLSAIHFEQLLQDPHANYVVQTALRVAEACFLSGIPKDGHSRGLDGSFYCLSCGKVNDLLQCWRKQMATARDTRSVNILCFRVLLSQKLLTGTMRYENLQKIVKEIIQKLKADVGPLTDLPVKQARGIVNRLASGQEVQRLCALAVKSLDSLLSNTHNPFAKEGEPSKDNLEPSKDNLDDGYGKEQDGSSSKKRSGEEAQDRDFGYYVKVIRWLECKQHIDTDFRQKFLTWYSLRATPQEVIVVFVDTLMEDPAFHAGQLVDAFSEVITSKKCPKGLCLKLFH